jgi:DNA polymerase III subunit chi
VPPWFGRFNRVAEPVGADEAARAAARERYRYYQDRGYTLNTHKL